MIDKTGVKRSFSRSAATYDAYSAVQKDIALELASLIRNLIVSCGGAGAHGPGASFPGPVLDIGCGTGGLIRLLENELPGARFYGCDMALPMLSRARDTRAGRPRALNVAAGDLESLPFKKGSFGVAVSSLAYQWAPDIARAFKEAGAVLKPGGLFILSTLGPGTLTELRESYSLAKKMSGLSARVEATAAFTDATDVRERLEAAGFEVLSIGDKKFIKSYRDMMELLTALKNVGAMGAPASEPAGLNKASIAKAAARIYMERFPCPGGIRATYDAVYAAARKR